MCTYQACHTISYKFIERDFSIDICISCRHFVLEIVLFASKFLTIYIGYSSDTRLQQDIETLKASVSQ